MTEQRSPVFLTRVALKNYRSIAACDFSLGPLTFLVGANGSGKSNFLDALRLVTDSLLSSLDHALRERGGIQEVRRRSSGHPTNFGVRLSFLLKDGRSGTFAFEVGARPRGEFVVKQEECSVGQDRYVVREGNLVHPVGGVFPPVVADRLYLVNAAGLPQFRPVFDALSHMGFYNINPAQIRKLQSPDRGDVLARDGANLASLVGRLERADSAALKERVAEYLAQVVPGVVGFEQKRVGHMETIEFRQTVEASADAWRFPAINMSDGTLRVLAVLVGLFQAGADRRVPLVGLEEPETALHPAAAGVLRDCIVEASRGVQVIVTSHSAELLDDTKVTDEQLRAVEATGGRTKIARVDEAARSALHERLYTAGELLRANQLLPDANAVVDPHQLRLFDEGEA
ncbi:MAG: AAA family ATPase [Deltaproteobacteria bacterium]|nr:AAA family ATPase [Deltaproteobacteria bacterium]